MIGPGELPDHQRRLPRARWSRARILEELKERVGG